LSAFLTRRLVVSKLGHLAAIYRAGIQVRECVARAHEDESIAVARPGWERGVTDFRHLMDIAIPQIDVTLRGEQDATLRFGTRGYGTGETGIRRSAPREEH